MVKSELLTRSLSEGMDVSVQTKHSVVKQKTHWLIKLLSITARILLNTKPVPNGFPASELVMHAD